MFLVRHVLLLFTSRQPSGRIQGLLTDRALRNLRQQRDDVRHTLDE